MVDKLASNQPQQTSASSPGQRFSPARSLGILLNLVLVAGLALLIIRIVPAAQRTMTSTADSLRVLATSFDRISATLLVSSQALESTSAALEGASNSLENSTAVIESASGVVDDIGDGLIGGAQGALIRMKTASDSIDTALNFLDSLGLLGSDIPLPEDSLSGSIAELNQVLDSWPADFQNLGDSLSEISLGIEDITASLDEVRADVDVFLIELDQLVDQLETLSENFTATADQLDLWSARVPAIGWLIFGSLAPVLLVNTWIQISSMLKHRKKNENS